MGKRIFQHVPWQRVLVAVVSARNAPGRGTPSLIIQKPGAGAQSRMMQQR
jgi:hypothetical protein